MERGGFINIYVLFALVMIEVQDGGCSISQRITRDCFDRFFTFPLFFLRLTLTASQKRDIGKVNTLSAVKINP